MEASSVEAQQPSGAVQELPPVEGEDLGGEGYSEAHVETYVTEGMPPDHGGQDEEEKEAVAAAAAAAGGSIAPLETCPTKLIINYLPQDATEQKLRDLFTQVAELESCKLVVNKQTGNSYGFAFVNYHTHEDALKAIERFNGEPIGNKNMKVSFARPQSDAIKGANLYIRNLPADADEAKLRGIFEKWGSIIQTKVLEPAAGSTDNRKTGFVRYNFRVEAEKAILELNGKIPAGGTEPLLVKFADQRAVSHGRGGRGGGGGLRDGMPSRGGGGGRSRGGHWDDGIGMSLAMLRGGRGGRPRSASGGQGRRGGPRGHGGPGRPEFHYRGGFTFAKSLGEGADPLLGHLGPAAAAQQRALHHLHPAGVPYGAGPAGYVPHHPHVLRSGEGHYPQYPIHAGHPAAAAGVPGVAPGVSPYEIPVGAGAHGQPASPSFIARGDGRETGQQETRDNNREHCTKTATNIDHEKGQKKRNMQAVRQGETETRQTRRVCRQTDR
uniref:RRM domain-containing protein n=1 Tax=Chromera velia CCMP2878 TaxID=1169474 RepID=A0A0G4HC44_9ALVE|eukprot:Cvel_26135.t1-p1 / transcript=Cvel_26135.t1 / gene=Cvel_26135 / organism=Chromera_velia_CCMP2878 / gene_product=ELAV-like protein 3, putative / transcript_product=ELAV-like protein 3, putative / location=Cvel_scaffold3061:6046-7527(-) / protein_length=494 / sequence_SO=supercontig / SO=protein_coding / is_pseudo=false